MGDEVRDEPERLLDGSEDLRWAEQELGPSAGGPNGK